MCLFERSQSLGVHVVHLGQVFVESLLARERFVLEDVVRGIALLDQHQADARGDAHTHTQRNGLHDLLTHL